MISRDEVSDKLWKWRYKLSTLGKSDEKTVADFSKFASVDSSLDGIDLEKSGAGASAPSPDCGMGSSPSVKAFYEGPNSRDHAYDWVDYPPKQLSRSAARAQDRVAIKVYKIKDTDRPVISGRSSLKYHMMEVQNPLLVSALDEVLRKQDIHLDVNEVATFNAPFRSLYFAYDDLVVCYKALAEDSQLRPFMLLFIRLLDDIFAETRAKLKNLRSSGLVSFKLAWTYFPKDSIVITWGNNCELLCKVEDTEYKQLTPGLTVMNIKGKVLRFNGDAFLWESIELMVEPFAGNKPITKLSHYPLDFHTNTEEVKTRLLARGKKVLDYQGLVYCSYTGIGVFHEGKKVQKHNVDCRILIDVVGYNKHHLQQGVREGSDPESAKKTVTGTGRSLTTIAENAVSKRRLTNDEQERNKKAMLSNETDLMFMSPMLEGYALKNKEWLSFFVEDIRPLVWNDEAFDHLVYDEQQKDLVMSFVESHGHVKSQVMEDVIVGKGEGLVVLLSGPPGTGKTLTAEAVADRTHRPLFYLQAEDLGINAATLGANVKKVFEMATEWDAVILLDEADVFMAERHPQDIARNELVSIFLRELEYYRGIIFLTTNLYSTIDSAFRSRVSLHLLFNTLTPEARTLVWRKFLERLPGIRIAKHDTEKLSTSGAVLTKNEVDLDENDIKELGAWQLNGREIKTAVKMVKSWCDHKGYQLNLSRLENGIKVTSPHASKNTHEGDTSLYDE